MPDSNAFTPDPNAFTPDPNAFTPDPNAFTPDPNAVTHDPKPFTVDPQAVFDRVTKPIRGCLQKLEEELNSQQPLNEQYTRDWEATKEDFLETLYDRMGQTTMSHSHPSDCTTQCTEAALKRKGNVAYLVMTVDVSSQRVSHLQKLHLKCPVTVPFEGEITLTEDALDTQTSEPPVIEEAIYHTELHRPLKQMIQYLNRLARKDSEGNPDWNRFKPLSWENQECMGYAMLKDFERSARQRADGRLQVQLEDGTVRNDQGTLQYQTRAQVNGKSVVSRWYDGQRTANTLQTDAAKPWTLTKTYRQLQQASFKDSGLTARDGRREVHKRPTESSAGASDGGAGPFDGAGLYEVDSQVVGSASSVSRFMGPPLKRRALASNASEYWPPSASQVEQAVFDLEPLDKIMGSLDVMSLYAPKDDQPGVDIVKKHLTKFRQQFEGGGATSASVSSGVDFRYFDVATGALLSLSTHAAERLRPEIAKISGALAEIKKPFRARSSLSVFSGHEQESAPLHDLGDQTRISPLASHDQQPGIGSAIGDLPEGSSRGDGGQKPARDPFLSNLLN